MSWRPLLVAGVFCTASLSAQTDSAGFLAAARAAAERYRDPARASADGYRPEGPETAAMGQHWVHLGILIRGRVEAATPAVLEYVTVAGTPVLAGVAYAVVLGDAESPPDIPVPASRWHSHGGTLADEVLSGRHGGMGLESGDRVAVLHAWLWVPNPAGVFEAENWLLPLAGWVRGF